MHPTGPTTTSSRGVRELLQDLAGTEDALRRIPRSRTGRRRDYLRLQHQIIDELRSRPHPWPHAV